MTYAPVIPFENARLKKVEGGGTRANYTRAAGPDATRWQGDVGAYVGDELVTELQDGAVDEVSHTHMYFPASVATGVRRGDFVTYTVTGEADPHVRKVLNIQRRHLAEVVRLSFENA